MESGCNLKQSDKNKIKKPLLHVCMHCGAMVDGRGHVQDIHYTKQELMGLDDAGLISVSHGYCKSCFFRERDNNRMKYGIDIPVTLHFDIVRYRRHVVSAGREKKTQNKKQFVFKDVLPAGFIPCDFCPFF